MRLSEAIIEGAKLRPQSKLDYFVRVGREVHSCALGSAYEGATGKGPGVRWPVINKFVWQQFGATLNRRVKGPRRGDSLDSVGKHIVSLNFRWDRERIAEWVRTVEESEAA